MNTATETRKYPTLAESLVPLYIRRREIAMLIASSWMLAITAQIMIPLYPVPISGQTFGVLLIGAILGSKRGALAVMLYLSQGAMGLPFFTGGMGGMGVIVGPTGGYLIGFVFAAFVIGWLTERGWMRFPVTAVIAMIIGNSMIYLCGLPWLSVYTGWDGALGAGLIPFIPGDLLKIVFAMTVLRAAWIYSEYKRSR